MNVGPPRIAMIIATSAATRTLCHYAVKFSATASSPTAREPLTSTTSPGPQLGAQPLRPPRRRWRPSRRRTRAPARRPRSPARSRARGRARRSRGGTRARLLPSSAISPSTAIPPRGAGTLGEVLERRAHRDRVRVVAVVQQQTAAGADAPPRGASRTRRSALRQRDVEALRDRDRRARVLQLVLRRVARLERHRAEVGSSTRLTTMSVRVRYGSSSGSSGTTATPPGGSASISSAFARATFSIVSTSSRCTGPTFVITPTSGLTNDASHAIWPEAAHPQLADADLGVLLDPADRERDADLGVVVALVRDRPPVRRAERERGCPSSTSSRSSR